MMNNANIELLSDCQLQPIEGLTWLPWIGREYFRSEHRLLIVGESHYLTGTKSNLQEVSQPDFTRNVIQTFCVDHNKPQPTFDNLIRCLSGEQKLTAKMRAEMWQQLAFYNFVQRPMKTNQKRPTKEDLQKGWNVFAELIKILQPTECIFVGFAAADNSNPYRCRRSKEKVGKYAARLFTVKTDEQNVCPCIAIKHTSQYFSWTKWRELLKNENFLF